MKIMIGADSRSVLPMPHDWVAEFKKRTNNQHEIKTVRQYYEHWLFSIYIFETYLKDLEDKSLDLIIVQSGWHEGVCYWTPDAYKNIVKDRFNPDCLVKEIKSPRPLTNLDGQKLRKKGTKPEPLYLYVDKKGEQEVFDTILSKTKHCLFIGLQTIKNENNLDKEFHLGKEHHYDALRMNERYSNLNVDFLHMPMDWVWVQKNTCEDNLHYNDAGRNIVTSCIESYVNRIQTTGRVKKCVDSTDFYKHALVENDFAIASLPSNSKAKWNGKSYWSRGKILPGVSVVIMKDEQDVTGDGVGNIMIKSSHGPEASISNFYGYHDTGDIGFISNDGDLFVIKERA